MIIDAVLIAGAYLFGSLPVVFWIGKANGIDIRREFDAHSSLWKKSGYKQGLAAILWDIFKGPVFPLIAWGLDFSSATIGLCGLAVVSGQMWPIFLGFQHGEKGNTTGIGASFAIAPIATSFAVIPVAAGAFTRAFKGKGKMIPGSEGDDSRLAGVSDSMPLGMLAGFAVLPISAWLCHKETALVWTFTALFFLIVFRRMTASLLPEIRGGLKASLASVLWNRFLYDRSYY
ncbi:MAG: glycerol-3-phosphate acyltransferase [Dehalococcoidia bacterium]